jgi:hypothetical protein
LISKAGKNAKSIPFANKIDSKFLVCSMGLVISSMETL